MQQKTKIEIITETKEYYAADPSRRAAKDAFSCFYYEPGTGKMCGAGRCMVDPKTIAGSVMYSGARISTIMLNMGRKFLKQNTGGTRLVFGMIFKCFTTGMQSGIKPD